LTTVAFPCPSLSLFDVFRSTPLRPGSYFSVGHSTQVAAISTVLTYLIVLVQFKESRT
jgi:high-affinity nickel permease